MSIKELCILMLVCLVWGGHFIVLKLSLGEMAEPLFYAAVRMSIIALILLPKLKWHKGQMRLILSAGLCFGALNYAFLFTGLELTTSSAGAITFELYTPFTILLAVLVLKDKIGWWRSFGIMLAFAGVLVVATIKPSDALSANQVFNISLVFGILLVAAAALCEAIGAILVKQIHGVSPFSLLAWFAVMGVVVLWPLTLVLETNQLAAFKGETRFMFLGALAYSVFVVSMFGHTAYYWLLQRLPVFVVATGGMMTTVFAVGLSALILHEVMSGRLLLGCLMTLCGVGFILLREKMNPRKSKKEKP